MKKMSKRPMLAAGACVLWLACDVPDGPSPDAARSDAAVDAATPDAVVPPCPLYYQDADGDGYGTGAGVCMTADAAGHTRRDGDCDDTDATVMPAMFASALPLDRELPLDGIDHNCDELDYPFVNGPFESFQQPAPEKLAIPDDARCAGRGLSIVAVEPLWECGGGAALHIGNRGDETVTGAYIETTWAALNREHPSASMPAGEPERVELPSIGAGEVVRVVSTASGGTYLVRIVDPSPAGDCAMRNMEGVARGPFVDCF